MFYLLHGDDEFTNHEHLKKLRQEGDFAYNEDTYNGAETDLTTITTTCSTYPFLAEQRLVVVEGLPKKRRGEESAAQAPGVASAHAGEAGGRGGKTRKGKKAGKGGTVGRAGFEKALVEYIPLLPDTTVLVVLVDELLANELDKLAMYAGGSAVITVDDVRKLSAQVQEARVFDLTDALAQRNRKQALDILHDLLADGEAPLRLISTITSQVRSLILVKELSQKGIRAAEIASTAGLSPFVAEKALRQIGKFTVSQLENSYRQLLATDAALKRSRMTPEMALDLLVVNFGGNTVRT